MKKLAAVVKNASGFSMMEVLLSMVIIAVSAIVVIMWQKSSWSQTTTTNRLMVAGHIVDKQVENQRMNIAKDPPDSFPTFKSAFVYTSHPSGVIMIDSTVSPPVSVKWFVYDTLHDPQGNVLANALQVKLTAWWEGCKASDTLRLETRIAKNF